MFDSTVMGPMISSRRADRVPVKSVPAKMSVSLVSSSSGLFNESIRSASIPLKAMTQLSETWAWAGAIPSRAARLISASDESLRTTR